MAWGQASGGVTGDDGYQYHVFLVDGTLDVTVAGDFELLVVGGGGNGAYSSTNGPGGAGGGGVLTGIEALSLGANAVTVSTGAGSNSELGSLLAYAGAGAGGSSIASGGGGTGANSTTGPAGTGGVQGNNGANGKSSGTGGQRRGGGGGGAGGNGISGTAGTDPSMGGIGVYVPQFEDYGGSPGGWFGAGGSGHGGAAQTNGGGNNPHPIPNTGAGGSSRRSGPTPAGIGASGVVMVRWERPTTRISATLSPGLNLDSPVGIIPPLTNIAATLSMSIAAAGGRVTSRVSPIIPIRKSVVWTHGLDGTRKGAIR